MGVTGNVGKQWKNHLLQDYTARGNYFLVNYHLFLLLVSFPSFLSQWRVSGRILCPNETSMIDGKCFFFLFSILEIWNQEVCYMSKATCLIREELFCHSWHSAVELPPHQGDFYTVFFAVVMVWLYCFPFLLFVPCSFIKIIHSIWWVYGICFFLEVIFKEWNAH